MKNDKRAIIQAASLAEKATTFLHSQQPQSDNVAEEIPVAAWEARDAA
ncbi:hypothetical protein ABE527_21020 [Brucella sp. TWI432]